MMRKEIRRLQARGTSGVTYTVVEYQNFTRFTPISGAPQDVPGSKALLLSDGRHVNFIDSETFKIVATGEVIKAV